MTSSCDRRAFLTTCAAATAAGITARTLADPSTPAPDANAPLRQPRTGSLALKKALKIGMIGEGETLAEKFTVARHAGFDGVELDSPNDLDVDDVLAAKEAAGIEIPGVVDSVHWSHPLSDSSEAVRERGRAGLEQAIRDCHAYGGSSVLLVPAVVNRDVSYVDAYERSQREIRRVLPLARELGVQIAIENVWNHFLLSPIEAARYVDELGMPTVGWHFDIGNIVNYGWPAHWIAALAHRIVKLDVKDFSRQLRDEQGLWKGFNVEIGDGHSDWPGVRAALREIGYAGWMTAEVGGGDRERLAEIARRMDRVLNADD